MHKEIIDNFYHQVLHHYDAVKKYLSTYRVPAAEKHGLAVARFSSFTSDEYDKKDSNGKHKEWNSFKKQVASEEENKVVDLVLTWFLHEQGRLLERFDQLSAKLRKADPLWNAFEDKITLDTLQDAAKFITRWGVGKGTFNNRDTSLYTGKTIIVSLIDIARFILSYYTTNRDGDVEHPYGLDGRIESDVKVSQHRYAEYFFFNRIHHGILPLALDPEDNLEAEKLSLYHNFSWEFAHHEYVGEWDDSYVIGYTSIGLEIDLTKVSELLNTKVTNYAHINFLFGES